MEYRTDQETTQQVAQKTGQQTGQTGQTGPQPGDQAVQLAVHQPGHGDIPRAVALMLLASACVAGTTLLAKALGTGALGPALHPLQISQGRFLFAFLTFGSAALILRPHLQKPALALHLSRSAAGWGGVSLMFAAAAFIPLADATAISFLNPVFGMMLAVPFLGERVGPLRWSAAGMALLGALILLRPTPGSFQPAALLALGAALLMGVELIFIKKLSGREAPFQILLINNAIGLGLASAAAFFVWAAPNPAQWGALMGIGGLMAAAQTCFIHAIRRADASFISPLFYTTLVWAALYDRVIFDTRLELTSWLGAGIILAGAAFMAWRETRSKRRAGHQKDATATETSTETRAETHR